MISLRRFLYIIPVFSLPIMMTLESGLLIYFISATGNFILFSKMFEAKAIKKYYGIPLEIEGSILQKMV